MGDSGVSDHVVDHSLTPGGRVTYFMTGPEGDRFYGYSNVLDVDAPPLTSHL